MTEYEPCVWPYDPDFALRAECYVVRAPRAKLYVFRVKSNCEDIYHKHKHWHYCFSAGANCERSHSGFVGEADDIQHAVNIAVSRVQRSRSWQIGT